MSGLDQTESMDLTSSPTPSQEAKLLGEALSAVNVASVTEKQAVSIPKGGEPAVVIDTTISGATLRSTGASSTDTAPPESVPLSGSVSKTLEPPAPHMQSSGSNQTVATPPVGPKDKQLIGTVTENIDLTSDDDETYAKVAKKPLCKVIIDQRQTGSMTLLDQSRFDILNALLIDLMMTQIGKNVNLPQFDDVRLHLGTMRIRSHSPHTFTWLEKYLPTLDMKKLWKGAKLTMIDFGDIPKPYKFNVWIRGIKKPPQDIFKLLEAQNRGIVTKSWTVLSTQHKNGGTLMTIGVGQDSLDTLKERSNSLFCGVSKALFTVIKGQGHSNAASDDADSTCSSTVESCNQQEM